MESTMDALNEAFQEFIGSAAAVFETNDLSGGQKSTATDNALERFKHQWEIFRVSCDRAEEFVESAKQRIGSECLVDEATGPAPEQDAPGLAPISAVRLEQMSKAVRWLVIELQHGSGNPNATAAAAAAAASAAHPHASAPFDARFSEDPNQ
ncbi:Mediator of RNA polymerase II transcription subunit 32 [Nymphaea thermarum]|nr:Mediator of RNA polymerase II transcription subunit 32 [Nymphaea thermarum]